MPYRDSKLTLILKDAIGGSARTWMVANVSPLEACRSETLSTLTFASRAAKVRNALRPTGQGEEAEAAAEEEARIEALVRRVLDEKLEAKLDAFVGQLEMRLAASAAELTAAATAAAAAAARAAVTVAASTASAGKGISPASEARIEGEAPVAVDAEATEYSTCEEASEAVKAHEHHELHELHELRELREPHELGPAATGEASTAEPRGSTTWSSGEGDACGNARVQRLLSAAVIGTTLVVVAQACGGLIPMAKVARERALALDRATVVRAATAAVTHQVAGVGAALARTGAEATAWVREGLVLVLNGASARQSASDWG